LKSSYEINARKEKLGRFDPYPFLLVDNLGFSSVLLQREELA